MEIDIHKSFRKIYTHYDKMGSVCFALSFARGFTVLSPNKIIVRRTKARDIWGRGWGSQVSVRCFAPMRKEEKKLYKGSMRVVGSILHITHIPTDASCIVFALLHCCLWFHPSHCFVGCFALLETFIQHCASKISKLKTSHNAHPPYAPLICASNPTPIIHQWYLTTWSSLLNDISSNLSTFYKLLAIRY